jgi:hypothetical protein
MASETTEFWRAFEKETGEKVEAQCEGVWYHDPDGDAGHDGLLILTDKSFRFKYISDTQRQNMGMGIPPEFEDQTEFTVVRDDIVSVQVPKRGFIAWLVRRAFPRCSVVARGRGGLKTYFFSADASSALIAALGKAWPMRAAARRGGDGGVLA